MTAMEQTIMGAGHQDNSSTACLSRALADALKQRYPYHTAKMVARDMGSTAKAAENLLNGHLSGPSLGKLILTYGPGFVAEAVMTAAGLTLETYIERQAEEADAAARRAQERAHELHELQARMRADRSRDPVPAGEPSRRERGVAC
jgi:hypothetical protein